MMVQLRPRPAGLVFPRAYAGRPRYLAGLGLIPGYTPAQQAMADAFQSQYGGAPAAVYQAPVLLTAPACSSGDPNTADSPECIAQLLANQQANMAAGTAANYNVDIANCNSAWAENDARYTADGIVGPPNTCGQRTFGLTLPDSSGGTNILTPNAGSFLGPDAAAAAAKAAADAAAQTIVPLSTSTPSTSPSSTPAPGAQTPQSNNQTSGGSGAPGGSTPPVSDKTIYWILGGGTLAVILFFVVTR